jgi:hypothetical protein
MQVSLTAYKEYDWMAPSFVVGIKSIIGKFRPTEVLQVTEQTHLAEPKYREIHLKVLATNAVYQSKCNDIWARWLIRYVNLLESKKIL